MDNTQNYLLILEQSLKRKNVLLDELIKLTNVQRDIVECERFDEEVFNTNVEQKAILINELEKLDKGFQILYDNVKAQIEGNRHLYADDIHRIQGEITLITDKSASLMVMESKNKELVKSRFAGIKREIRQMKKSRESAASYYKTMNNISSEPYFLDRKK